MKSAWVSSSSSGFTLPELLIVMALMITILTWSMPNFSALVQQNRLHTITLELTQQLQLARNEAIKRNQKVTLCKSDNTTQCNTSAEWESGWILFENLDGDGRVDSVDSILLHHAALPNGVTLRGVGNFRNRVTYKPTGDSTSFSRLVLCDQGTIEHAQVIYINSTGRIRLAEDHDGDTIPEDSSGNNIISCKLE